MTKARSVALVCAGPISRSGIARLPKIIDLLGPVKSGSLQRASRAVNVLGAGTAVHGYKDLDGSRTILLNMPDRLLPPIVAELAASDINWKKKIVLLCSSSLDSLELGRLKSEGAEVGSFVAIHGFNELRYIIEGTDPAVRQMRTLIQHRNVRAMEIRSEGKDLYLAGVACATTFLTSIVTAAVESLRESGLKLPQAQKIAAQLVNKTMGEFLKAGPKGVPAADAQVLANLAGSIEDRDPKLARHFRQMAAVSATVTPFSVTPDYSKRPN
jgi:predicted short-subunit dehydrogenase-like oxidoreductase (DUF2520 family)